MPLVPNQPYNQRFFDCQRSETPLSAEIIAPLVLNLVPARSVIDVGCGVGVWLEAFRRLGVTDFLGVDSAGTAARGLLIPRRNFRPHDLRKPLRLRRTFDLGLCLEVAEHLPPDCATGLIRTLTRLAPVVLFSAAVPGQGGTRHMNEQWQEHWAARFANSGFCVCDPIRPQVWSDERVAGYYAQNMLLFARKDHAVARRRGRAGRMPLSVVHPRVFAKSVKTAKWELEVLRDGYLARESVLTHTQPGDTLLLIDDQQWDGGLVAPGRRVLPFPECGGLYAGPPANSQAAVAELDRLRREGANCLLLARPSFWWSRHYAGFIRHLNSASQCLARTPSHRMFRL